MSALNPFGDGSGCLLVTVVPQIGWLRVSGETLELLGLREELVEPPGDHCLADSIDCTGGGDSYRERRVV